MMKINRKINRGIMACVMISSLLSACTEFETNDIVVDKPQSIIDQEVLDGYVKLKTAVDNASQPNFKLGVELTINDIINNGVFYRLMQTHFDQAALSINHMDFVGTDGVVALGNLPLALDTNKAVGMGAYAGNLVWHEKQQAAYLNSLIADIPVPGQILNDVVADFNTDALGKVYPTTSAAIRATVVADPDGRSGNALRILRNTGGNNYPQILVTLPVGRTLGQYSSVSIDFKGAGCCGLFGGGMQLGISTQLGTPANIKGYGGPSSFGVADNVWGRGTINLSLSNLNLTTAEKALTTFYVTIGSNTGAPDYLLDNLTLKGVILAPPIVKTPEEKRTIITAELRKWIKAVGEAGKDKVQSWGVVYQPMDETTPANLRSGVSINPKPANVFYWQDYLGKDYAAVAIGMLKQYANPTDKIFFTETNLVDNPAKIQGLKDFITYTAGKGGQVDGIATELALNIDADKGKIEAMLQSLATSGKLIKIRALDIGTGGTTPNATPALYQQQAEMYKWFVKAYFTKIPAAQRAGITFKSAIDRASGDSWRGNEPVGLWTNVKSGSTVNVGIQRKPAYLGVLEALQGK
ncbi:endo-1,4-beta-xylanase [Pedobacter alpinus]|uniref:Endo-1,4-beta-xylanase n=1 Tax=Pedobacter alpinus TaxID=1590643 RepID=A0ABW5TUX1_9SPHI